MTAIIDLAEAVKDAVAAARTITVLRRYVAFYEPSQVEDGVWYVMLSSEDITQRKFIQNSVFEIQLVYQRGLPESSTANPNPLENNTFFDGCMDEVEATLSLFREEGALFEETLSGCTLTGIQNLLYRPDLLLEYSIFTSIIKLTYRNGA